MVQQRHTSLAFRDKRVRKDKMPPYRIMSGGDDPEGYKVQPDLEHYRTHPLGSSTTMLPHTDYTRLIQHGETYHTRLIQAADPVRVIKRGKVEEQRPRYNTRAGTSSPVLKPVDCYKSRVLEHDPGDGRVRHIDLRLAQASGVPPRIAREKTRVCLSEFPEGILPRPLSAVRNSLDRSALREGLHYSTTHRKLQAEEGRCSVNYFIPLRIFGKTFPIVKRNWDRVSGGWVPRGPRDRAQSAPPYSRPTDRGGGLIGSIHSEYSSVSDVIPESLQPNYECECYIQDEEQEEEERGSQSGDETDSESLGLQKYLSSVEKINEDSTSAGVTRHFNTFHPPNSIGTLEISQIHELLTSSNELKRLGILIILEKLSSVAGMCDTLTKEYLVTVMRLWVSLITSEECTADLLLPITTFIKHITENSSSDLWLDDVYKEQIIEHTTSKMAYDGTRAHYCTLLLRIFSDSSCCAGILANTALPECILLPQVKQSYWDESRDTVFLDEDIFLQEEILKIFCNIAQSSGFGRKILICQGVVETVSRILAYASCPVQYQAALLVGALCEDDTGCDHVTSELINQRADGATCMRHLGNLFLHSKCLRVKAATGSAMSRMFGVPDRRLASRGLRLVHEVLFTKQPSWKPSDRPSTAPARKHTDKGVTLTIIKDVLYKYTTMCTTKGPFSDGRFFRCRLMALQTIKCLLHFPLKLEGRSVPFHTELAKLFFSVAGDRLFADLKKIAEKHRYVKILQDKIQKIQLNLIKKSQRNARVSEMLDIQLQEIEEDNSVLKIPNRDFELARNELVYCEIAIKTLSMILAAATSSLNLMPIDSEALLESTRRYNSQYTTMQDSLYNKYAMSVIPGPSSNKTDASEEYLVFVKKLLSYKVVETLVPWFYCVYPPITEHVVRCVSSLFVYSAVHSMTVHCSDPPEAEAWIQPSDVSKYLTSRSVTPRHISSPQRTVQLIEPAGSPRSSMVHIPMPNVRKHDVVVEQCTHHIGHLCSRLLTQNLLICNNHTVSQLAAQLLRDISRSVTREHLLCMVDDDLLERLTEYLILCNGDEERIVVALDILETLISFQPTLGKLYNSVGGLDRLVARLLSAGTPALKQKLLQIINSFPSDARWCQLNKVDCVSDCQHLDVWHKVTDKWENQDNVSKLLSVEM